MLRIAHKLAEERGEELGCDMDKVKGMCKQRTRCALGVACGCARKGCGQGGEETPGRLHHGAGQQAARGQLLCTHIPQQSPRARRPTAADGYGMEGRRWEPRAARTT